MVASAAAAASVYAGASTAVGIGIHAPRGSGASGSNAPSSCSCSSSSSGYEAWNGLRACNGRQEPGGFWGSHGRFRVQGMRSGKGAPRAALAGEKRAPAG